ncbi:Hypothetical_protein [Hexamita inflata]|uniref:Hypothetical_protein n=1 Tax=Hexamita inflata TaxID=28002 RepID=A0ABP1GGU9_9EUKA
MQRATMICNIANRYVYSNSYYNSFIQDIKLVLGAQDFSEQESIIIEQMFSLVKQKRQHIKMKTIQSQLTLLHIQENNKLIRKHNLKTATKQEYEIPFAVSDFMNLEQSDILNVYE